MKYNMTLLCADNFINDMMAKCDMKNDYKVFVTNQQEVSFTAEKPLLEEHIMKIINESTEKNKLPFWIPAILFAGEIYVHESIMELSDGKKTMFVKKNQEAR